MDEEILVTVISFVYNHEKYVRKTLEGFVSQKTSFQFEVLIHDDASTDNSVAIIREFEKKYPDIIRPIYQTENQYQKGVNKSKNFLLPKVRGKYLAFCEGDDYWSDSEKLQKQVDILEHNPECTICFHKTGIISENGEATGRSFPKYDKIPQGRIPKKEFLSLVLYTRTISQLQFQISSILIRTEPYREYINNQPEFRKKMDVGDLPLYLYMGTVGDAYYLNEEMSCYREFSVSGWNSQHKDISKRVLHLEKEIHGLQEFDKFSERIVHDSVEMGIQNRQFAIYLTTGNLPEIKKMTTFYRMLASRERLLCYLKYYFPGFYKFLKNLKNKRDKKKSQKGIK